AFFEEYVPLWMHLLNPCPLVRDCIPIISPADFSTSLGTSSYDINICQQMANSCLE
ncbi:hypothetical protein WA026_001629, partial [Henosepilachna vigintioctopunctata]